MRRPIPSKTYLRLDQHPAWKKDRNEALIRDKYPHWPATGTIGMKNDEIAEKYGINYARVHQIIRNMKRKEFGYAE